MSAAPSVRCDRCGERFADPARLALHRGRQHAGTLTSGEEAAFEEAVADEQAWLMTFRSHVAGALAASTIVLLYVAVALPAYLARGNPVMLLMPVPGLLIFSVVTYWWVYTHRKQVEERDRG